MLDTHASDRHRYAAVCGDFTVDADPLEVQDPWLGAGNHAGRGLRRFTLFCCILAQHQYVRVFWNFVSIHILFLCFFYQATHRRILIRCTLCDIRTKMWKKNVCDMVLTVHKATIICPFGQIVCIKKISPTIIICAIWHVNSGHWPDSHPELRVRQLITDHLKTFVIMTSLE